MHDGFIQLDTQNDDLIRAELHDGLRAANAHTSPKYLYDALGSKLFEAICELPEYYPTRTEAAIFADFGDEIAASVGSGTTLIDLGAGNCAKAAKLFPALRPAQYVPVDISVDFLRDAVASLRQRFPEIKMLGVGMDFSASLTLPDAVARHRRLFFYPGSSLGNYTPDEALAYLQRIRIAIDGDDGASFSGGEGGLLIGVDLIKDHALLDAAYDDALGVTAAFNLNMLRHLNAVLGADFNVRDWQHRGFFNAGESRIEMHLEARRAVTVTWPGSERRFDAGERIHTENSYKYTQQAFTSLLERAGFSVRHVWTDPQQWFMVCHACPSAG
ncbi:MAG: L-histidine N(alpha)-methyltransferase [Herminiimonas sp.]|nr:L-histidine N(alpha)-methyltransferase [Herminiimonas sp.]